MEKSKLLNTSVNLWICLCALLALISWPLDGAIALRNISLVAGSLGCLIIISSSIYKRSYLALLNSGNIALLMLLSWTIFHYFAFSNFPVIELGELKSLWLRSFLAVLLGTTVGHICAKSSAWKVSILLSLSFLILAEYYLGFLSKLELSRDIYDGLYKSKAAVSYFLLFPYFLACAYIHFLLRKSQKMDLRSFIFLMLSVAGIGLCLFGFYFSKSLNGLLVAALCTIPLILTLLSDAVQRGQRKGLKLIMAGLFLACLIGLLALYGKHDAKLRNIIGDAYLGTQIDTYPNWQTNVGEPLVPTTIDGHIVAQSTYYRMANLLNGIRFIEEKPLGVGYTYLPYGYLMKQKYPLSQANHTHSGWVDFALGQGVPGLLLLWLAMFCTFALGVRSIKHTSLQNLGGYLWGYATVWVMGGIFIAWIFNEVSEREYIEQLFFIIALFAAGNTPSKSAIAVNI
jgi:hypothetical protein